jgi:hypothetical protein
VSAAVGAPVDVSVAEADAEGEALSAALSGAGEEAEQAVSRATAESAKGRGRNTGWAGESSEPAHRRDGSLQLYHRAAPITRAASPHPLVTNR